MDKQKNGRCSLSRIHKEEICFNAMRGQGVAVEGAETTLEVFTRELEFRASMHATIARNGNFLVRQNLYDEDPSATSPVDTADTDRERLLKSMMLGLRLMI